jgi:hypothetical protein
MAVAWMARIGSPAYRRGMKIDRETGMLVWPLLSAVTALMAISPFVLHRYGLATAALVAALLPLGRWVWERRKLSRERSDTQGSLGEKRPGDVIGAES